MSRCYTWTGFWNDAQSRGRVLIGQKTGTYEADEGIRDCTLFFKDSIPYHHVMLRRFHAFGPWWYQVAYRMHVSQPGCSYLRIYLRLVCYLNDPYTTDPMHEKNIHKQYVNPLQLKQYLPVFHCFYVFCYYAVWIIFYTLPFRLFLNGLSTSNLPLL